MECKYAHYKFYNHMEYWTESWANYKSIEYFGRGFKNAGQYISKNISISRYLWLRGLHISDVNPRMF